MTATAEIDKAGRLVIPKIMRDDLHLVPGTRVTFSLQGAAILIAPEAAPRGLYLDRGTLVYDAGPVPPSDVLQWIEEDRNSRINTILGGDNRK